MKRAFFILYLLWGLQCSGIASDVLISSGESWKYLTNEHLEGTGWTATAFDDQQWLIGNTPLGYGNGNENTMISSGPCGAHYMRVLFRKNFFIANPSSLQTLSMLVRRDDGIVIYINGLEIFRDNMPSGVVTSSTPSSTNASDDGNTWRTVAVNPTSLANGINTIAVEVHQSAATSSDLRFDLKLNGIEIPTSDVNEVQYKWVGALQPHSVVVVAKLTSSSTHCRVLASKSPALTNAIFSGEVSARATSNFVVKMNLIGLNSNSLYYYAIESNGKVDNSTMDIGTFKTPVNSASSFRFTVFSCAVSSDHQAYTAMANKSPLFMVNTGDLHYRNPNSATDINIHRTPFENYVLAKDPARRFFDRIPFAYMWDDHDYCGDGSDHASAGRVNARLAYQEYIPHYPLVAGSGDVPIYQAFTIGRIRFILTDLRSERTATDIMGATQKAWFKNECLSARNNNQVIAWISTVTFAGNSSDNWGGYKNERTELCNFFRDNKIRNVFLLSGDAHMIAIDNGSNHDFSTGSNNPFDYPVFQAAALNNTGSYKGGTYSEGGTFLNPDASTGQYGVVDISDNGDSLVTVKFTAFRTKGNSTKEEILTSYIFTRNVSGNSSVSLSARAIQGKKAIQLSWHTGDSLRTYIIERSSDSATFKKIYKTEGKSGVITDYDVTQGWNYYTLGLEGFPGIAQRIFIEGDPAMTLAPNPSSGLVTVYFNGVIENTSARYVLYDIQGNEKLHGDAHVNRGTFTLDVKTASPGEYILRVILNNGMIDKRLIVTP
jgi:hypothetical protein